MKLNNKIGNLIEINWETDLHDLQPDNVKVPINLNYLKDSVVKHGFALPFAVWNDGGKYFCIDGHTRKQVLLELIADGVDVPKKLKAFEVLAKDRTEAVKILVEVYNQKHNPFAEEILADWLETEEIEVESLQSVNVLKADEDNQQLDGDDNPNDDNADESVQAIEKLSDKYVIPPFSVLNTRDGKWQERKKSWRVLIGDNGETRDDIKSKVNNAPENWDNKPYKMGKIQEKSISILDPVLSEIVNIWFGVPNGNTFDCFAGDTVFGYVSSYMGNDFTGIELRQEQADINNTRTANLNANYICDDGRNILNHIEEESQDLLFSCPPYYDLEVYSDLPNDASNQGSYEDFISILDAAFSNAIKCLKDNRFAVIVCGDVRDKNGMYYRFPDNIKDIFVKNGMSLYNELILVQSVGNGALRANRAMRNRKVVKVHEQVLVFYKGDVKKIKDIYPKIQIDESTDAQFLNVDLEHQSYCFIRLFLFILARVRF